MIKLINDDCIKAIKTIPDKSIDLVIMDPPYKSDEQGGGKFGPKNRAYHNELKDKKLNEGIDEDILVELLRVMKKVNIYIFCNKNQLLEYMVFFKKYNMDLLTWHKTNPVPTCNNKYLSDTEYLLFFRDKGVKLYGEYKTKKKYWITSTNKLDKQLYKHPTVKPIEIIKILIGNSSKKGELVFDPYMGSGTTGAACKELHRDFIGVEIDDEFYKTAERRIKQ